MSRTRYRVGLVMFLLPLIPTYVMAYAPQWLPDHSPLRLYVNLAADFIFLSGLFVLGGDFWDKLRALFVYDARVEFGPPHLGKSACRNAPDSVDLLAEGLRCDVDAWALPTTVSRGAGVDRHARGDLDVRCA